MTDNFECSEAPNGAGVARRALLLFVTSLSTLAASSLVEYEVVAVVGALHALFCFGLFLVSWLFRRHHRLCIRLVKYLAVVSIASATSCALRSWLVTGVCRDLSAGERIEHSLRPRLLCLGRAECGFCVGRQGLVRWIPGRGQLSWELDRTCRRHRDYPFSAQMCIRSSSQWLVSGGWPSR